MVGLARKLLKAIRPSEAENEAGVVSTEAVAVTAVFVLLAIAIAWVAMAQALGDAIAVVGEGLVEFIETNFP